MDAKLKELYLTILKEELVPAMGCTEPISVAYAAALARKVLGQKSLFRLFEYGRRVRADVLENLGETGV